MGGAGKCVGYFVLGNEYYRRVFWEGFNVKPVCILFIGIDIFGGGSGGLTFST